MQVWPQVYGDFTVLWLVTKNLIIRTCCLHAIAYPYSLFVIINSILLIVDDALGTLGLKRTPITMSSLLLSLPRDSKKLEGVRWFGKSFSRSINCLLARKSYDTFIMDSLRA